MSTEHLTQALRRIVDWDELSAKDRMDCGSDGERDYYRNLARETLAAHEALAAAPQQASGPGPSSGVGSQAPGLAAQPQQAGLLHFVEAWETRANDEQSRGYLMSADSMRTCAKDLRRYATMHAATPPQHQQAAPEQAALTDAQLDARDAARLDFLEQTFLAKAAVWLLPCGPELTLLQIRTSEREIINFAAVPGGVRAAIDAAIAAQE